MHDTMSKHLPNITKSIHETTTNDHDTSPRPHAHVRQEVGAAVRLTGGLESKCFSIKSVRKSSVASVPACVQYVLHAMS